MKKLFIIFCCILLLNGCGKEKEPFEIEPTVENFARYIAEDYQYGASGEFVDRYIDNTYSTNLFLINRLKDSYADISIVSCDETGVLLNCDGTLISMDITVADGRISKIQLSEAGDD